MSDLPVLHYFKLGRLGRGEVVRLFFHELKIEYKDVFYNYGEEWDQKKDQLQLNLTGTLPVLEIDGHSLSQHLPILRYLSRRAGSYDGETNFDQFLVDAVSDVYVDWRAEWVANLGEVSEKYKTETVPRALRVLESYYKQASGPYLLGDKVTYADFAVYQIIDNDACTGAKPEIPEALSKLMDAMKSRPNIKEYIAQRE